MSKKKLWIIAGISITLIVFIFVALILGTVGYSRTNSYYLKPNGEVVYCNSNIWMELEDDKIIKHIFCSYNKRKDEIDFTKNIKYKKWNGQYRKGYFNYEKEAN